MENDHINGSAPSAKSFLFFREIIEVTPEEWAQSFLENGGPLDRTRKFRNDLGLAYLRNYIIESYLVAAKVADKLRYLMPAQTVLSFSIKILLAWLAIATITVIVVPEERPNLAAPDPHASTALVSTP